MKNSSIRNLEVEGLKGMACLLVLLFHVFCRYSQIYLGKNILWMENWGDFGVTIFFVISGYYFVDFTDNKYMRFNVRNFLYKRFNKLWPCYALAITLTSILTHLFYLPERMCTWEDWLLNLFWINGFIGTTYVDSGHWYLTTLISYIVIIAFAKKFKVDKTPLFYIGWLCARFCFTVFNIPYISKFIGGQYIGYIVIAVVLKYFVQKNKNLNKKEMLMWMLAGVVALYSIIIYRGTTASIEVIFVIPLFYFCVGGGKKIPFMKNKLLIFFGSISYPLYLIHQNLSFIIEYYLMKEFDYYHLVYGIIAIIVDVILAVVIYRCVNCQWPICNK